MKARTILCLVVIAIAGVILTASKLLSRKLINNYKRPSQSEGFLLFDVNNKSNESVDCRNRTIDEFPPDFFTLEQKRHGGVIVHILITAYLFCAVAIVCDEYFVHSLNRIAKDLKLKEDVAGATFMAAGSSAPELFTSLVGVIIAKSDVGTGTIVGSAVFNVLFIIAVCALAAKHVLQIDWYPLSRDSIFYIIVIGALLGVLSDGYVKWYESTILIGLYAVYILIMYFNENIQAFVHSKIGHSSSPDFFETVTLIDPEKVSIGITRPRSVTNDSDDDDDDDQPANPFEMPVRPLSKAFHVVLFPILFLFFLTIPDPRRPFFRRFPYYFLSFLISTIYLGALTYLLVWMVVIIAYTFDIPDTVAGLTVLAAGTSVPEVVSGIIVTRKGKGEMAISNSLGSNIFDILICLGLPWLISNITTGKSVKIFSKGIFYSTSILMSTVFILIISFLINRWRLDKRLGILMLILWAIVTVITCLFEYDIFGDFSLPICV